MSNTKALIVLDGWGHSDSTQHNAISAAKTPIWDKLIQDYTNTLLLCSGKSVGLPENQIGNSEVGHMTMGAGRVIFQDLARINLSIEQKDFFDNEVLTKAITTAKKSKSKIHLLGLLSDGGVHSHQNHLFAILDLCKKLDFKDVVIHAFLDGRDTAPKSATKYLNELQKKISDLQLGTIASISGRYYAMDRDKRYERTQLIYELLTNKGANIKHKETSAITALEKAYARNKTDEFVEPTAINYDAEINTIQDDDALIFFNFRSDRAKQLSYALTNKKFDGFTRQYTPKLSSFVTFTEYAKDIPANIAFPKKTINNNLGEIIQNNNLAQLRIAETEKYAHVTFFFNGGRDQEYNKETRVLVPSPKVATYDLKPEMSAPEITDKLVAEILSKKYDFILCNYANADMVGHTGDFNAAVKAVEAIDNCLGKILKAILEVNGEAIITADHGNVEVMYNKDNNQPHTAHSNNLVPCLCISNRKIKINDEFKHKSPGLADIAPSILSLLELNKPKEITGTPIFELV